MTFSHSLSRYFLAPFFLFIFFSFSFFFLYILHYLFQFLFLIFLVVLQSLYFSSSFFFLCVIIFFYFSSCSSFLFFSSSFFFLYFLIVFFLSSFLILFLYFILFISLHLSPYTPLSFFFIYPPHFSSCIPSLFILPHFPLTSLIPHTCNSFSAGNTIKVRVPSVHKLFRRTKPTFFSIILSTV